MPKPRAGEDRDDFLDRCIPIVIREGREPDQAVAICVAYYDGKKDKAYDLQEGQTIEYWKAFDRRRSSFQRKFAKVIYNAIKEQLRPISEATNVNELRIELKEEPLREAYVSLYTEVGDAFARSTYSGLKGHKYTEYKQTPLWIERMRKYALIDASSRIVAVTETTRREINKIIVQGLEEQMSIPQIRDRIAGTRGLQPLNGTLSQRAERIARTEIISASNAGSLEGARSTGLNFKKRWLATPDDRTREDHVEANGQIVDKDDPFVVGGENLDYPGHPAGSASNVINCRCTQIYLTGPVDVSTAIQQQRPIVTDKPYEMMASEVKDRSTFIDYLNTRGIQVNDDALLNIDDEGFQQMAKMHEFCLNTFGEDAFTYQTVSTVRSGSKYLGQAVIEAEKQGYSTYLNKGTIRMNASKDENYWRINSQPSEWNSGKGYMTTYLHEMIHHYDYSYTIKKATGRASLVLDAREMNLVYSKTPPDISRQIKNAIIKKYGREGAKDRITALGEYAMRRNRAKDPTEIPTLAFEKYFSGRSDEFSDFVVNLFIKLYKEL